MPTQAERRASTRQALLVAAAQILVDEGPTGFTTAAVTQRAGLSNGALFGHFGTRLELLAATVEHMLAKLRADYEATFMRFVHADASPETLLETVWISMNDPNFAAVLSVYTQARTDTELLAAIHEVVVAHGTHVGRINRRVASSFTDDPAAVDRLHALGTIAILAMQGLIVSHMVGASTGAEREMVTAFARLYEHAFTHADALGEPGGPTPFGRFGPILLGEANAPT